MQCRRCMADRCHAVPVHEEYDHEDALEIDQGETTDDVRARECPFCEVHHDGAICPVA